MGRRLLRFLPLQNRRAVNHIVTAKGVFAVDGKRKVIGPVSRSVLVVFFFMISLVSYGQGSTVRYVRTEANGVQVYESIGNEGVLKQDYSERVITSPVKREIEEYSLPECQEALNHIDSKIQVLKSTPDSMERKERLDTYEKGRKRVMDRIEVLTSNKH